MSDIETIAYEDSAGVKWGIKPDDIEWLMTWSGAPDRDGKPREDTMEFEAEAAVAHLLLNEVIFLNSRWWNKSLTEAERKMTAMFVNCNDVFAWGFAESEELPHGEIENLYRMWRKDPIHGPDVWCIIRRKELPQDPVAASIQRRGIWDLKALAEEHGLRKNHYSGVSHVITRRKYDAYCAWCATVGKKPRKWDAHWWAGWKEFEAANPDWNSPEWKAADAAAREKFRAENGFSDQSEGDA